MKAAAKHQKTETISDLQDADVSEEKKATVPISLYSCDFRLIEVIQPGLKT